MSINCAFGFSLILLILVALNIYFFYTLNTVGKKGSSYKVPRELDLTPNIYREIFEYLNYLPSHYKSRNTKFIPIQRSLVQSFNSTNMHNTKDMWHHIWQHTKNWESEDSLFPQNSGIPGMLLRAMTTSDISQVDVAPRGTQLKLLLTLDGYYKNYKAFFKPKRYELTEVLTGNIYGGFDRHNSEVFAYYLAMVMNFKWIAPCGLRRIHVSKDVYPVATRDLRNTMVKNGETRCIYGKCLFCHVNKTVCPDKNGEIEGATILFFDKKLQTHASPWRRSYNTKKMGWETEHNFCTFYKNDLMLFADNCSDEDSLYRQLTFSTFTHGFGNLNRASNTLVFKLMEHLNLKRILNLVDVSLFDFLIQNGDRHHYEVYKDKIVLLDNGKGLGNPSVDELDILAPLYQCCKISFSTWQHLEMLSGGILTETIKMLSSFQGDTLATEEHFVAVERRLLKIYATVQYCIGKHGSAKVFVLK